MSTSLPLPELLTRQEAAEYLGVKPQTLAVWAVTGRYDLPVVKVGRLVRYRRSDLDKWLESRTCTHTGPPIGSPVQKSAPRVCKTPGPWS